MQLERSSAMVAVLASLLLAPAGAHAGGPVVQASIQVRPMTGPGGTLVMVRGSGFQSDECRGDVLHRFFRDLHEAGGFDGPTFRTMVTIPTGAAAGFGTITAVQVIHDPEYGCLFPRRRITGSAPFKVTAEVRR